jgi:hypothetical protein
VLAKNAAGPRKMETILFCLFFFLFFPSFLYALMTDTVKQGQ